MLPTNGRITQDFYTPVNYIAGRTKHEALDIVTSEKEPIIALGEGVVTKVIDGFGYYPNKGYGNEVWITYDNGLVSRACHCDAGIKVKEGQRVSYGTVTALTGQTGHRFPEPTIHTHYETMIDGKRVDPLKVEYPQKKPQEQSNQKTNEYKDMRKRIHEKCTLHTIMDFPDNGSLKKFAVKENATGDYWTVERKDIEELVDLFSGEFFRIDIKKLKKNKGTFNPGEFFEKYPEVLLPEGVEYKY